MPASAPRVFYHHQLKKSRHTRKRPLVGRKPELSISQVLSWADAFHERTGQWPNQYSGRIPEGLDDTWTAVNSALRLGLRGLAKGNTLAQVLAEHRSVYNRANPPNLTVQQILAWADAHHHRTGEWPGQKSGRIPGTLHDTWVAIDQALKARRRGLSKGGSLAQLLAEHRGVRNRANLAKLTVQSILAWVDAYHRRTERWPKSNSGPILESPGETWAGIESALIAGRRGLRGGSSLARLLAKHRGVRNIADLPPLSETQILRWADAHHKRTGHWPKQGDGPVTDAPGEIWGDVAQAMRVGLRGLSGKDSLPRLLAKHRGARNHLTLPRLSPQLILKWADGYHQLTGQWPKQTSGPITDAPGETWRAMEAALRLGLRGLPGGSSLLRLLAEHRGIRNKGNLPPLKVTQILKWANAHHRRTGHWPKKSDGAITDAPGETWEGVNSALLSGRRGLPRTTLSQLLAKHRGIRNRHKLSSLNVAQILKWADAHHRRTGQWPKLTSGPITEAPGETWQAVHSALCNGRRGLPGRSSLPRLLAHHRGVRNVQALPPLSSALILKWADAYHRRTGEWPTKQSGLIPDSPGEPWTAIDSALRLGLRGSPGGSTLARFLKRHGRVCGSDEARLELRG